MTFEYAVDSTARDAGASFHKTMKAAEREATRRNNFEKKWGGKVKFEAFKRAA